MQNDIFHFKLWFYKILRGSAVMQRCDAVLQVKSRQAEMIRILDSKSIQYELVDISVGSEVRDEMRSKAGDPTAVPPQLFNEDQYCGVRKTNFHQMKQCCSSMHSVGFPSYCHGFLSFNRTMKCSPRPSKEMQWSSSWRLHEETWLLCSVLTTSPHPTFLWRPLNLLSPHHWRCPLTF